jgi:hypothetical protein
VRGSAASGAQQAARRWTHLKADVAVGHGNGVEVGVRLELGLDSVVIEAEADEALDLRDRVGHVGADLRRGTGRGGAGE